MQIADKKVSKKMAGNSKSKWRRAEVGLQDGLFVRGVVVVCVKLCAERIEGAGGRCLISVSCGWFTKLAKSFQS